MKNKKFKQNNNQNEDTQEIKTLLIITAVIIVVSLGLYLLTESQLKKEPEKVIPEATISTSEIMLGTMFTRPYNEYYVFIYGDAESTTLDKLFTDYEDKEDSKKIYYVNIDDNFNKYAKSDKSNKKPTSAQDLKIDTRALILIKDGKVSKYYETIEEIEKVLK